MTNEYLSTEGKPLTFSDQAEMFRAEHVLQRYRDVWLITESRPFLAVDEKALRARMAALGSFAFLSPGHLIQNITPEDLTIRLSSALLGPGLVATASPAGDMLVDGEANPLANVLYRGNKLLSLGESPFAALSTRYLVVDGNRTFQREIAQIFVPEPGGRMRPRCDEFDFAPLAELVNEFHDVRFGQGPAISRAGLAAMLDRIFELNIAVLAFVEEHHASRRSDGPKYNYKPGSLTRYGRLVHNEQREPRIETAFSLMHYEKALQEFDSLKRATKAGDLERQYAHGVYCIIAVAGCIEAIGNRLHFDVHGQHVEGSQPNTPVARINYAGRVLAERRGTTFNTLGGRRPETVAMEQVRILRNSFVHATEAGVPIDSDSMTSTRMAEVNEVACRDYLEKLRLTVAFVFDQLDWLPRPIATTTHPLSPRVLEIP